MIINNQEWTPIVVLGEIFAVQNKSGNSIFVTNEPIPDEATAISVQSQGLITQM